VTTPPFDGISSRLCTSPFLIMIDGVVASLPARGSPPLYYNE